MVTLLDGLEHKTLVTRRADPADRRRNVVELTDTGREVLTEATRASDAAEQQHLTNLTDHDVARLRELLERIATGEPQ